MPWLIWLKTNESLLKDYETDIVFEKEMLNKMGHH